MRSWPLAIAGAASAVLVIYFVGRQSERIGKLKSRVRELESDLYAKEKLTDNLRRSRTDKPVSDGVRNKLQRD